MNRDGVLLVHHVTSHVFLNNWSSYQMFFSHIEISDEKSSFICSLNKDHSSNVGLKCNAFLPFPDVSLDFRRCYVPLLL